MSTITGPELNRPPAPIPTQQSGAKEVGKTAAKVAGAVGIAFMFIIIRRIIGGLIVIFGLMLGSVLGGGIWFLICPALLLVGYWVALRYVGTSRAR